MDRCPAEQKQDAGDQATPATGIADNGSSHNPPSLQQAQIATTFFGHEIAEPNVPVVHRSTSVAPASTSSWSSADHFIPSRRAERSILLRDRIDVILDAFFLLFEKYDADPEDRAFAVLYEAHTSEANSLLPSKLASNLQSSSDEDEAFLHTAVQLQQLFDYRMQYESPTERQRVIALLLSTGRVHEPASSSIFVVDFNCVSADAADARDTMLADAQKRAKQERELRLSRIVFCGDAIMSPSMAIDEMWRVWRSDWQDFLAAQWTDVCILPTANARVRPVLSMHFEPAESDDKLRQFLAMAERANFFTADLQEFFAARSDENAGMGIFKETPTEADPTCRALVGFCWITMVPTLLTDPEVDGNYAEHDYIPRICEREQLDVRRAAKLALLHIHYLYLDESTRGSGIGFAMLDHLVCQLQARTHKPVLACLEVMKPTAANADDAQWSTAANFWRDVAGFQLIDYPENEDSMQFGYRFYSWPR